MVYTLSSSTWIHFFTLSIIHDDLLNSALPLVSAIPFQQLVQRYNWEGVRGVRYVRLCLAPGVGANSMPISRFTFGTICLGTSLGKSFAERKWITAAS